MATPHSHGTGCTLSAAITALLSQGAALPEAVDRAKTYVWEGLRHGRGLGIGKGRGPVDHLFAIRGKTASGLKWRPGAWRYRNTLAVSEPVLEKRLCCLSSNLHQSPRIRADGTSVSAGVMFSARFAERWKSSWGLE